jgi:hypothetical protein
VPVLYAIFYKVEIDEAQTGQRDLGGEKV